MSLVETKYNESLNRMTGIQRVERTLSLFSSMKEMLQVAISKEFEGIKGPQLQKKIAERLYLSDKQVHSLIEMVGKQ